MDHFYFAADKSRVDKALAEKEANILFSAAASWNSRSRKFYVPKNLHGAKRIFIDSGGFTFRKAGKYPFSLEEYLNYVKEFVHTYPHVIAIATPDYPCTDEPDCNARENIKNTLNTAFEIIYELNPFGLDIDWYIPLHGKTLEDYIYAIELFCKPREEAIYANEDTVDFNPEQEEMLYDFFENEWLQVNYHIALGSLKRLTEKEIVQICKTARELLPSKLKIHGFGLPLSKLKNPEIIKAIDSADSAAWRFGIADKEKKIEAYHLYQDKINSLVKNYRFQQNLASYL